MKKLTILIVILAICLIGCSEVSPTADDKQNAAQEQLNSQAVSQVPMPGITKFQEKRLVKMIYELRDRADLMTYVYNVSLEGRPVFMCRAIGYGVPYAAQYSNPTKPEYHYSADGGNIVLGQAEPNGLFMPSSADGTWIMAIDPDSKEPKVIYVEPRVIVSPFKLPNALGNPK